MADRKNRFEAAAASRDATGERLFILLRWEAAAALRDHRNSIHHPSSRSTHLLQK